MNGWGARAPPRSSRAARRSPARAAVRAKTLGGACGPPKRCIINKGNHNKMNKDRRDRLFNLAVEVRDFEKELNALYVEANQMVSDLNNLITQINDKRNEIKDALSASIDEVKSEEEEAFENMPEGFQNSERGEYMQEAISSMDDAINVLDGLDDLEEISELEAPDLDGDVAGALENASQVG